MKQNIEKSAKLMDETYDMLQAILKDNISTLIFGTPSVGTMPNAMFLSAFNILINQFNLASRFCLAEILEGGNTEAVTKILDESVCNISVMTEMIEHEFVDTVLSKNNDIATAFYKFADKVAELRKAYYAE